METVFFQKTIGLKLYIISNYNHITIDNKYGLKIVLIAEAMTS